jgi:flagellar biosynthesis protein FlhA
MQGWQLNMPPKEMQELMEAVGAAAEAMVMGGLTPVLLTHPDVRLVVRRIVEGSLPQLFVVSYNEIAPSTQLRSLGVVE